MNFVEQEPGYPESFIGTFPIWKHVKTGGLYHVMGIANCSTNGERDQKERSVVYFSITYQTLHYREVSEFLDGRFEPVTMELF